MIEVSELPTNGVFFSIQLYPSPPWPADPYPDLPLYTDTNVSGVYWFDDRTVDYGEARHRHHHRSSSGGGVIIADDEEGPPAPGGTNTGSGGGSLYVPTFTPPGFGFTNCDTWTNFWLVMSQTNSTTNLAIGAISNTLPGLQYWLLATTNLADPHWTVIQMLTASNSYTPFSVTTGGSNCLFLWAVLNTNTSPPIITVPPTNLVVAAGSSATFSVTATGVPSVGYQWYFDGTNLPGATSSTFTIPSVSATNLGIYTVFVTNVLCEASASAGLGMIWSNYLGPIDASAAIDPKGNIYIANMNSQFFSLTAAGATNWTATVITGANYNDLTPSATFSPDGSAIYIGTQDSSGGYLDAFNPSTGSLLWQVPLGGWVSSTPAVATNGSVYVVAENNTTNGLFSINPHTTNINWIFYTDWGVEEGIGSASSPAIGQDGTVYFTAAYNGGGRLYAVNPSGGLSWFFPFPEGGAPATSPAIDAAGNIVFGSGDGYVYNISPTGTLQWLFDTGSAQTIASSPAIGPNGLVVVATEGNMVYGITNGAQAWAYTGDQAFISSPAIAADGTVVIGCADNTLYAITNGAVKWSYTTGGYIFSSPAISPVSGAVVFGSDDGYVYSLSGVPALADSAWPMFHKAPNHSGAAPATSEATGDYLAAFLNSPQINTSASPPYFSFDVSGTPNSGWEIYSSTNLSNWTSIGSVVLDSYGLYSGFQTTNISGLTNCYFEAHAGAFCSPIVGFANVTIPAGSSLIANPFQQADDSQNPQNSAAGWFKFLQQNLTNTPVLPYGSILTEWNGVNFVGETNLATQVGWFPNGDNLMVPGRSAFFINPTNSFSVPFAGWMPQQTISKSIVAGENYVSSLVAIAGHVQTDLGYNPNSGDKVLLWNGTNFTTNTYTYPTGWSPSEPYIKIGEGFVILAVQSNIWTKTLSTCPDTFVVPANPLWTDSGATVVSNNLVIFVSTNTWSGENGQYWNANGIPGGGDGTDVFLTDTIANQFALIAFVGPNPYYDTNGVNRWGDNTYFPRPAGQGYFLVGTNGQFTSDRAGELWFGINDDATSKAIEDNFGAQSGHLVITNAP